MALTQPLWIALIIPLAALWLIKKQPSPLLNGLRLLSIILLLIAICRPALKLPARSGTIVVVGDRSSSMPPDNHAAQKEIIDILQSGMGKTDKLAVVSFGHRAAIEHPPQHGKFSGFINDVGKDQSQLSKGIETALGLIPEGTPGRILILSDGKWTGSNPSGIAAKAAARNITIDYRLMQRKSTNDLAIDRIYAPVNAASGQSFMITAWLHSPVKQEISYEFKRGPYVLASGKKVISSGLSNIIFRDTAEKPGTHSYSLKVTGINKDPVPENNLAKILVGISGPHSTLCVTSSKNSSFVKLLKKGGLEVDVKLPNECKWTLEEIAPYSAILIENIPAGKIGIHGMENISLWVQHTGKGLMMTGGKNSYAPGGYFRSPLEKIMPVSMELRQEHRKILVSIIIALDRSGSMAVSAGGGKTKMDLANIGAVQVMDLLSPMDEIGVIAVDSAPHTIVNINTVEKNRARRLEVLQIGSMGGGIFVYEALSSAANMLLRSNMKTRHIILFADAADSEEPGKYKELLEKCRKANITVSVIGLGTPGDIDANLLKDIALRGGGQCFFTNDPNEIPRLFAQDTFTIARNTFIDETSSIRSTGGLLTITGRPFGKSLEVGGYNLCYARPRANIAVVTEDEYNAPIAASWYAGTGRVLCYTGEADGKFTGPIADWQGIGDFFTGLVRWSTGNSKDLPGNMLTKEKIENGDYIVELHLDPERKDEPFSSAPGLTILRGEPGKKPATEIVNLEWTSADILSAHIPLKGNETVLPILDLNKKHHVVLSPVCLPYSPEFELPNEHKGLSSLEHIARITGGNELTYIAGLWKNLSKKTILKDISHWFLLGAIFIFLLEILHRRTGILHIQKNLTEKITEKIKEKTYNKNKKKISNKPAAKIAEYTEQKISETKIPDKKTSIDAMRKARQQARRRTERK